MASRSRIGLRWIVGTVLVLAIVSGCVAAGLWQLRRLGERRDLNARIRDRSAETVPLPPAGGRTGVVEDDLVYRRVAVRGTYDASGEVLVRFRTRRGLPGYEVVTPLETDEGPTVLVDRGWIPLQDGDRWPVAAMAPPSGEVEVTGLLAPSESGAARLEERPSGVPVAAAIDPRRLAAAAGVAPADLYPVYLLADDGGTAGAVSSFPVPVDPPSLTDGPHRSYAIQWFLFASVGVVGWVLLLRRRGPLAPPRPERQSEASSASMASSTEADLVT